MISNEGSGEGAFGEKGDEDNASGAEAVHDATVHRDEDDVAETEENEEEK